MKEEFDILHVVKTLRNIKIFLKENMKKNECAIKIGAENLIFLDSSDDDNSTARTYPPP